METKNDLNSLTAKVRGEWTAEIAKKLKVEFPDFDVFYDHGDSSGRIVSHFGTNNQRGTQLSYLDIAVVKKNTDQAIVLIEVEETANRPKTIIADIFAFLLGDVVMYKKNKLKVSNKTTLIILGFSKTQHLEQTDHIRKQVEQAKSGFDTSNSRVGVIDIDVYSSREQLLIRLTELVRQAINR